MATTTSKPLMTHAEKRKRRERIAKAVKKGASVSEAARAFQVTVRLAQMACQEFGVPISDGRAARAAASE